MKSEGKKLQAPTPSKKEEERGRKRKRGEESERVQKKEKKDREREIKEKQRQRKRERKRNKERKRESEKEKEAPWSESRLPAFPDRPSTHALIPRTHLVAFTSPANGVKTAHTADLWGTSTIFFMPLMSSGTQVMKQKRVCGERREERGRRRERERERIRGRR